MHLVCLFACAKADLTVSCIIISLLSAEMPQDTLYTPGIKFWTKGICPAFTYRGPISMPRAYEQGVKTTYLAQGAAHRSAGGQGQQVPSWDLRVCSSKEVLADCFFLWPQIVSFLGRARQEVSCIPPYCCEVVKLRGIASLFFNNCKQQGKGEVSTMVLWRCFFPQSNVGGMLLFF